MPSSNSVWSAYLKHHGFIKNLIPNSCPDCYTVNDFTKDNPIGTFILGTGEHAVAVVDGDYKAKFKGSSWGNSATPIFNWSSI